MAYVDKDIRLPRDFGPNKLCGYDLLWGELTLAFVCCRLGTLVGRSKMLKLTLACCKVYISESRNKAALEMIERAAKLFPEARIINKFEDDTYNRVGYTLVSKITPNAASDISPLKEAVFAMVKSAFEVVDLDKHRGSHPRLGVVDHICFHPLADSSLEEAASIARSLASEIGTSLEGLYALFSINPSNEVQVENKISRKKKLYIQ